MYSSVRCSVRNVKSLGIRIFYLVGTLFALRKRADSPKHRRQHEYDCPGACIWCVYAREAETRPLSVVDGGP